MRTWIKREVKAKLEASTMSSCSLNEMIFDFGMDGIHESVVKSCLLEMYRDGIVKFVDNPPSSIRIAHLDSDSTEIDVSLVDSIVESSTKDIYVVLVESSDKMPSRFSNWAHILLHKKPKTE